MVRPNVLLKKIAIVRDHIDRVREKQGLALEDFLQDRDAQDVVCFNLYQAIQGCTDIASHIVADEEWGVPGSYREAIHILAQKGVIPVAKRDVYQKMIGFRNRLAHEYVGIDLEEVHKIMQKHLSDLEQFTDRVVEYFRL